MDEKTKAELDQIMDMISIYQSSIDGADVETVKLIEMDLNKKKQQLSEMHERLNEELSSLYDNGGNEIDPAINQLQNEIQKIDNSLETISDLLIENTNLQEVNTLSEDKEIEEKIEGLDDFVPEDGESTVLNDSETMEITEEIQEQDFSFTDERVDIETNMQEDIKLSNEEEEKTIVENVVEEELKTVENESNSLEEEINSVKTEQNYNEEELKPIEEEQNPVEEEVKLIENKPNITSDSVMVYLREPSKKYREDAEIVVNSRPADTRTINKSLDAKAKILVKCKEALLGLNKEKQEENTLEEQKEPKEQDYDKDERIR